MVQVEDKLQNPLDVTEMFKLNAGLYSHIVSLVFGVENRVLDDMNHSRSDLPWNKESKLRKVCYNLYRYVGSLL